MRDLPDGINFEALEAIWALVPPGEPLRNFTNGIPRVLTTVTGPQQADAAAQALLGADPASVATAAMAVKAMAGEIDTLLHAVGIVASLPALLDEDERVEVVSVAHDGHGVRARNPGMPGGDLVTNKRVAEFTFVRWNLTKSNGVRQPKIIAELLKLATDPLVGDRKRFLYAGQGHAIQHWVSTRKAGVATAAIKFNLLPAWERLGSPRTVRDLWAIVGPDGSGPRVHIEHLPDLVPGLEDLLPPR